MSMTLIVVLSLVTYRVTRFAILDTLISEQRKWLYHRVIIGKSPGVVRLKIHDLLTCFYCLSIWVAAGAVAITAHYVSVPLPVWTWLAVAAGSLVAWRVTEG